MALLKDAIQGAPLRNSHAFVVDELGRAIVRGEFPQGAILPGDAELVARFGVSRTVLREAMKTLGAKGLIVARARIGTRVTERRSWNLFDEQVLSWQFEGNIDRASLRHLSDVRMGFEPMAARLAAEVGASELTAQMHGFADEMADADTNEAFALADLNFHLALLEASGNPFMLSLGSLIEAALVTVFRLSSPAADPDRRAAVAEAHRAIARAIEARDPETAATATRAVITVGRDRVSDAVEG